MESLNPDYEAMAEYFALQSDAVKTHSQIVDNDLVGQDYMLHIDMNTPKVFTPMMPRTADPREDNTTARVTVAPTLLGCYIGYNRAHQDFGKGSAPEQGDEDPYRGGYDICLLPFQHCLKIDDTLVPDATASGEHWLVGYNEATREYQPEHVGKVFVSKITQQAVSGEKPATLVTMYIQVVREAGFKFSPKVHLSKGYWKVQITWKNASLPRVDKEEAFEVNTISEEEWLETKKYSAALLSYREKIAGKAPSFYRW